MKDSELTVNKFPVLSDLILRVLFQICYFHHFLNLFDQISLKHRVAEALGDGGDDQGVVEVGEEEGERGDRIE